MQLAFSPTWQFFHFSLNLNKLRRESHLVRFFGEYWHNPIWKPPSSVQINTAQWRLVAFLESWRVLLAVCFAREEAEGTSTITSCTMSLRALNLNKLPCTHRIEWSNHLSGWLFNCNNKKEDMTILWDSQYYAQAVFYATNSPEERISFSSSLATGPHFSTASTPPTSEHTPQ